MLIFSNTFYISLNFLSSNYSIYYFNIQITLCNTIVVTETVIQNVTDLRSLFISQKFHFKFSIKVFNIIAAVA